MNAHKEITSIKRYQQVSQEKSSGSTYTPKLLADFVAKQIVNTITTYSDDDFIKVLDPAVGHGELLISLLEHLPKSLLARIKVYGFETNPEALRVASSRLQKKFPEIIIHFECSDFLDFVLQNYTNDNLFYSNKMEKFDLIIANPPYVRTQIIGSLQSKIFSEQFGLSGKIDLYYVFILAISRVLKPSGVAGIITSNRFMTTKSGSCVRKALIKQFNIRHVWDLGDTKIFDAAVLPAVLLAEGKNDNKIINPSFTSIYEVKLSIGKSVKNIIEALDCTDYVKIDDGKCFNVNHGIINTSGTSDGVWRVSTDKNEEWLAKVKNNCWGIFSDIGKIRVGVKTCADKVFINKNWNNLLDAEQPELLQPLITHHVARKYKCLLDENIKILYPHESIAGNRSTININNYPKSKKYLETHRKVLEDRKYVVEAGREWYEIWVPQNPALWKEPKIVFRDISEEPTFWIDLDGFIVNGDCYWFTCDENNKVDLLWLAVAVANSTFIECFYDYNFNNKLYAGRRRFITQYVEKFPLPNPETVLSKEIITTAKKIYDIIPSLEANELQSKIDKMI